MKILRKNEKKIRFFFSGGSFEGGGPYLKIPSFLKSDATLRVLPLLGKQRKILVYALIRSVASIRQLPLFGQKKTLVKINKFGSGNVLKMAKKGSHFLFIFAPSARKFSAILIRP